MPNLEDIYLSSNHLQQLHRETFKNNTKLKIIYLGRNRLFAIPHDLFSHLTNLNYLGLVGNICINKDFTSNPSKATIESELSFCGNNYAFHESMTKFEVIVKQVELLDQKISDTKGMVGTIHLIFHIIFLILILILSSVIVIYYKNQRNFVGSAEK